MKLGFTVDALNIIEQAHAEADAPGMVFGLALSNVFYYRNFCAGARCKDPNCRAMMRLATHDARKDMLPKEETILRHGLVTRPGAEGRSWEEWKVVVT